MIADVFATVDETALSATRNEHVPSLHLPFRSPRETKPAEVQAKGQKQPGRLLLAVAAIRFLPLRLKQRFPGKEDVRRGHRKQPVAQQSRRSAAGSAAHVPRLPLGDAVHEPITKIHDEKNGESHSDKQP